MRTVLDIGYGLGIRSKEPFKCLLQRNPAKIHVCSSCKARVSKKVTSTICVWFHSQAGHRIWIMVPSSDGD